MEEYKYLEFKERVAAGLRAVADIGTPNLSRCLKCGGFLVILLAFIGCGMSNDDIIRETKKCKSAGMDTYEVVNAFTYKTTDIICKPCKEEKARAKQQHLTNGSTVPPVSQASPKLPEQIDKGIR